MDLYAQYLMERTGDLIHRHEDGFATFRYLKNGDKKSVYIVDIFVVKKARKSGVATLIADLVAAEARLEGCTEMLGTVCPSANGSTVSLKSLLGYGFELMSASNDAIILRKDL